MSNMMNHEGLLRVQQLLDTQSFVEIGSNISRINTLSNSTSESEFEGVITGYGQMNGELVFVYAQDSQCINGSFGEIQCKRIANILRQAKKMKAPVIGILDSTGLNLNEGILGLEALGEVLFELKEAQTQIPIYTIISGTCGGSMGMIPQMSDFVFFENAKGECFVNSPNTLSKCNASLSQTELDKLTLSFVDFTGTIEEIKEKITFLCQNMPQHVGQKPQYHINTDDLNRTCTFENNNRISLHNLLKQISDSGYIFTMKENDTNDIYTGFIRLGGILTGVVATLKLETNLNEESRLNSEGMKKAAKLIQFCNRFCIPLLTILNNDGIETSIQNEQDYLFSSSLYIDYFKENKAPRICLIPDHVYGGSYSFMGSKSMGTDLVIGWENAQIGILSKQIVSKLTRQTNTVDTTILNATQKGIVDCVITPEQTRKYLISLFDMLATKTI